MDHGLLFPETKSYKQWLEFQVRLPKSILLRKFIAQRSQCYKQATSFIGSPAATCTSVLPANLHAYPPRPDSSSFRAFRGLEMHQEEVILVTQARALCLSHRDTVTPSCGFTTPRTWLLGRLPELGSDRASLCWTKQKLRARPSNTLFLEQLYAPCTQCSERCRKSIKVN